MKQKLLMLDDLFTTQEERDEMKLEKIREIQIKDIEDFPNHPFKINKGEEIENMKESIRQNGILVPVLVRQKEDGKYEMIAGHRRKLAAMLLGMETIPCIVRELSDDEATIAMVDSNLQREEILPSERAFAYKMKVEALEHRGKTTSCQVGTRWSSAYEVGKGNDDSPRQVYRYIRLTKLIPELLKLVDEKRIAFNPAVELSYLKEQEQYEVLEFIESNEATPSLSQAIKLKEMSNNGALNENEIYELLNQEKPNQVIKIKFNENRIRNALPKEARNIDTNKIEDFIVKAIEYYTKYLSRQRDAR